MLAVGLGLQLAVLNLAAIMLFPTVVTRAAGESEAYVAWAVFATVAVSGMTTVPAGIPLRPVRCGARAGDGGGAGVRWSMTTRG